MSSDDPDRSFTVWEPKDSDVVAQFDALPGSRSAHVIRAMELYLRIRWAAEERGVDIDEMSIRGLCGIVKQACLTHWDEGDG